MADYSDFPWRPGSATVPDRGGHGLRCTVGGVVDDHSPARFRIAPSETPDLNDPATVGALAGAVRAAYGRPDLYARPLLPGGWSVGCSRLLPTQPEVTIVADTEGEAWLAAWRARPKGGA